MTADVNIAGESSMALVLLVTFCVIIVLLLFAIGLNSLGSGVLGEYLGRTYAETKRRPLYIVQESMNLETEGPESEPSASAL